MIDPLLRPLKDALLAKPASLLGKLFSPNTVTVGGFLLGIAAAVCAATGVFFSALVLWLFNRAFDGLDGAISRAYGRQSDFGGYLDILLDFIVYAALVIGIAIAHSGKAEFLSLAFLLALFYINGASWMYLAALLEKRQHGEPASRTTSLRMPSGLIEGTETMLFFTIFLVFPHWIVPLYSIMALLTAFTIVQRLLWARRVL